MKKLIPILSLIAASLNSFSQITYSSLYTETSFNQKTVDVSKPVGATTGTATVNGVGAAIYSVPLWCPQGTNGMTPRIALEYNSQANNGIMGMGWSISGLSAITRVNKDIYHDGKIAPIDVSSNDQFVLDGVRMVGKSGQYGGANSTYALETEDFSYIVSYHTNNSLHWFSVRKKDGTELEYGRTTDSRFLANQGVGTIIWCLNRIIDINGNYIDFEYDYDHNFGRTQVLKKIKYTGNIHTALQPYNTIEFVYGNNRTDLTTNYMGGQLISYSHLLKQIKIIDETNTIKKTYELSYGTDSINSYLKELVEIDKNGSKFNSTIFKYGDIQPSITDLNAVNLATPFPTGSSFCSDFDGDGIDEVVNVGINKDLQVFKKQPQGAYSMMYDVSAGAQSATYVQDGLYYTSGVSLQNYSFYNRIDFNGDGLSDLLRLNNNNQVVNSVSVFFGDKTTVLKQQLGLLKPHNVQVNPVWNGVNFGSCSITPQDHSPQIIGDFDGDNKTDIVLLFNSSGTLYPCIVSYNQPQASIVGINFGLIGTQFNVMAADFDGDGKHEIIFLNSSGDFVYRLTKQSNGNYTATLIPVTGINRTGGSLFPSSYRRVHIGDFNGDGKADVFGKDNNGEWKIGFSTGKQWVFSDFSFKYPPHQLENYEYVVVADYNGDGKSDIFHAVENNGPEKRCIYYSRGYSFYLDEVLGDWDGHDMYVGDVNGDGRADILSRYLQSTYNYPFRIFHFREGGKENLLEKIADGYGNRIVFGYESLSNSVYYSKGINAQYPLVDIKMPWNVVRHFQTPNGSNFSDTYYTYEEALANMSGRGFLGFKKIIIQEPLNNSKTETITDINLTYYTPYVKEINTYNTSSNQQITHATNNISFVQGTIPGTFYQQLLSQTENNLLTGATTTTTNTYDNNNFGTIVSTTTNINNVETITTNTTYIQPGSTTVPCMPELVTVTRQRTGQSAATDKTFFTYDWAGRVDQRIDKYQTSYAVLNAIQYDYFGNVTQESIYNGLQAGSNPNTISNSYTYDAKGRFRESTTNPLGQTSYATWDAVWGKPLTTTGIDGIITTNTYNTWGKLTSTKLKTGTSEEETLTYSDGWGSGGNTFYTLASHPDKPDVKTWYDKLGREIKTETEHLGGQWTESAKTYDAKGNLLTETAPRLSSEPSFTTTYAHNDPYNRLTSVTDNFGTTSYTYNFLGNGEVKTTVTRAGQSKSTTVDAAGKTLKEEDHGGELRYAYDSRGNLLTVHHRQTMLMMHTYNNAGIKTNTYDVSAGLTTYSYDAFGRLRSEKDAKNHTHSFLYNELGLVTQRSGPEGTTSYTYYGAGGGLANQLASVSVSGVTGSGIINGLDESYDYDGFGRLVHKEKYIDGDIFTTEYDYDNNDYVTHKEYGNGYYLDYTYSNGYLKNVVQPFPQFPPLNAPYLFKGGQINGQGQYMTYALLNNVTTTNTYYYGYLTRAKAPGIQDLEMSYNYATGNLQFRKDYEKQLKEDFTYDNLNRLTQSVVSNYVTSASEPAYNITYDLNGFGQSRGNIISKTDVGSFATGFTAGTTSSSKNEETVISEETQDITYTSFRKTRSVKETDPATGIQYEQVFTYDAGYNRVKTDLYENGSLTATRLYPDDYEVNIDPNTNIKQYIHYIAGGDGLCAIAEVQDQYYRNIDNATYHVVYKDHLGSIVAATDVNGTIEAEQNFDAWGRERHPQAWNYNNVSGVGLTNTWLHRGYTGHEHMPHFSIINMNGRMYDPVLGRMMSPDNYVHSGTQGYNRYSYAMNNPLNYTDPDGQIPVNIVSGIVGALIGGFVNVAVHWKDINQGGNINWGKAGMAFGIGAAGGFVAGFTFGAASGAGVTATSAFSLANTYAAAGMYSYMASQPITSYGNHVAFGDPVPTEKEYLIGLGTNVALSWTGGLIQGKLIGLPWTNQPQPMKEYIAPIPTRGLQKVGGDDIGQIELKGQVGDDFFEGTNYTQKVHLDMRQNNGFNNHNFPESVKAFQSDGVIKPITGGDKIIRQSLLIEGNYNGKHGWFEFIKEADGTINHRFFETRPEKWLINK